MDEHERHFIGDLLNDDIPYPHEPPPPYSPPQQVYWREQPQPLPVGTPFVTSASMGGEPLLYSTPPPSLNMGMWTAPAAQPDRVIIRNMERPAFAPRNNYAHIPVATVAPTATKSYSAVAQCHTPSAVSKPCVRPSAPRKCSLLPTTVDSKSLEMGEDEGALADAIHLSKLDGEFKVNTKKGKKTQLAKGKARGATFTAQRVEPDDALNVDSRFQVLADVDKNAATSRSESKGAKVPKTKTSKSTTRTTHTSSVRHRRPHRDSLQAQITRLAGYVLLPLFALLKTACLWLHELVSELVLSTWEMSMFSLGREFSSTQHAPTGLGGSLGDQACRAWRSTTLWGRHVVAQVIYRPPSAEKTWWAGIVHSLSALWRKEAPPEWGLATSIELPTTGEQAMQRLLTCRERDAYSILGLTADCTDEEIRRYYKRQAVLVHPDKNAAVGSDEAFKVLAAAFDMVGTLEARRQYDMDNVHKRAELAQLHQLMTELKAKIDEALETMHCDCGRRHKRYLVAKREVSAARYCGKCGEHHAAKDNDIWAESRYLGCLWYYFACIGGQIYDITEWAACSHNPLKHLKANSHSVQYRLMSTRQTAPPPPSSEAFVEHLLSRLAEESTSGATYQPPIPADPERPRRAANRRRRK